MTSRVKGVVRVRPPFKTEVVIPGYSNVVRTITTSSAQKVIVSFQVLIFSTSYHLSLFLVYLIYIIHMHFMTSSLFLLHFLILYYNPHEFIIIRNQFILWLYSISPIACFLPSIYIL